MARSRDFSYGDRYNTNVVSQLPTRLPAAGQGGKLTPAEFSAAVSAITSAFGDPTRRDIYLYLRDRDQGATAAEIATEFDLHANVARHHLDKLAAGGYADVELGRSRTGAGRPSKRYVVRESQMNLEFPIRRDDLLGSLLGRALALLPPEDAEHLAEEVGIEYGRALAGAMEPGPANRSIRAAAGAVAEALTSHGFAAHTEGKDNGLRIVSDHCPFGTAAIDNPFLCAIDRGLVKGMLAGLYGDTDPELLSSRPRGDPRCVTSF